MAREVLSPAQPIPHQVALDVQYFMWVFFYSVLRNLQLRADHLTAPPDADARWKAQAKDLRRLFRRAFCQTSPGEIAYERIALSRCLAFPRTEIVPDSFAG
ncbi:hypothetical protein GALMADRAFT_138663 [Galerina marginata CBS 339.88]|uniref:Uncharacterized protein n=1 Tax=Galerina marginata (strain CBS 339.88) TaxID=685588 RepID=A0A067T5G4_GALM3|nr:hypothetical protein GALMADRAFT_138663 [Galerina marginata CBS 339.88]